MQQDRQARVIRVDYEDLYLCDIDGVLTDSLSDYQGLDEQAFAALLEQSALGELALATGRPFSWVEANILSSELLSEERKSKLIVASENGAVISRYEAGRWRSEVNEAVTVPNPSRKALGSLLSVTGTAWSTTLKRLLWQLS